MLFLLQKVLLHSYHRSAVSSSRYDGEAAPAASTLWVECVTMPEPDSKTSGGEREVSVKGHARQFMAANDVVVSPETTLAEAARQLARLDITGLPVTDATGRVVGIITESDMLDAFLAQRSNDVTVKTLMTEHVITVDEFTPADQVLTILRSQKIHHLPVVRQGVVVGLITPPDCHSLYGLA